MKKNLRYLFVFLYLIGNTVLTNAQNVGINTTGASPDNSAMLDITSTDKGLLIPRMDSTSRKNIVTPAKGLMVFDSTYNSFYYHDGTNWTSIGGGSNDNLGNHTANQNLQLNNNWLSNDGGANEGIYVDTAGRVGIGTNPSSTFHVSMGKISEVNVSMTNSDFFFTVDVCQSFTPTKNGELQSIELATSGTAAVTYNLYEGQGTGGTLIAGPLNQANPQAPYLFSGVTLTQGQQYTIEVLNPTAMAFSIDHFNDSYSGGQACNDLNADYWFKVNLLVDKPGVRIDDSQIQLNDYNLPITDGIAGQRLQTNGAGIVSWASPAADLDQQDLSLSGTVLYLTNDASPVNLSGLLSNTDNQDLSLSSNSLSLTNDATPVDLSGYLDNTDAQDLNLSSNTLSLTNDGTPVDLSSYLDNTDAQDLSLSGNTLSLTNDGTTVDLSTFAGGADNMGNHTASQNLQLNNNWLNNDGAAGKGVNIDNTGQVGINTSPAATFHVDMGGAQAVSPVAITHNNTTVAERIDWQSFTSTINGTLDSFSFYVDNPLGDNVVYRLYEGEGFGVFMYENNVTPITGQNTFSFPNIALQKNQIYTVSIVFNAMSGTTFYYNNTNPYAGGRTESNADWDMDFTAYMTQENGGFKVDNNGITINDYSLPSNDGNANQMLTTDGAGNVSWSSSGGGGADNLGDHTATQNIVLSTNRLTHSSGSSDGLSIDSFGATHFETTYSRPAVFKTTAANEGSFIEVNNAEGTRAIFGAGGTALIPGAPNDVAVGSWSNGYLRLYTNGSSKVFIDALGKTGIGRIPVTNILEVAGDASKTTAGNWLANSDARLKKNITSLSSNDMLNKLLSLNGVTYEWNDNKTNTKRPEGIQYGFTAQNIQEIFPSLVTEDNNGFLQTPYGTYDAMTVEAIRALNDKIETLQIENDQLKNQVSEVADLKTEMAELKAMINQAIDVKSTSAVNAKK